MTGASTPSILSNCGISRNNNSPIYVVDTSSWIDLERLYMLHNRTDLWQYVENLISDGRITCPREVRKEIERGRRSELTVLCERNKGIFVSCSEASELALSIMAAHPCLVRGRKINRSYPVADPFVIALACVMQSHFPKRNAIIVTEESQDDEKIPHVAQAYGIRSINLKCLARRGGLDLHA